MSDTTKSIKQKLLAAQKEIGAIKKDKKNPYFNSNYTDVNALLEVVKPILNAHDLVLMQPLQSTDGINYLYTSVVDATSGEVIESCIRLPDQPDPQKMGSLITYYRRYALQSMLSLETIDDDGNKASGQKAAPAAPAKKAWKKIIEKNYGVCTVCGAVTERAIGVSQKGKQYNIATCTMDKEHSEFLEIVPSEFENNLTF